MMQATEVEVHFDRDQRKWLIQAHCGGRMIMAAFNEDRQTEAEALANLLREAKVSILLPLEPIPSDAS